VTLALAALLGAAGVAVGLVGAQQKTDEPATLSGHGFAVRLPVGWEGQVVASGPVLWVAAPAGRAHIALRDVTALYAPLGSPLGFSGARLPLAGMPKRFRLRGRLFELAVETKPDMQGQVNVVLASLRVMPLERRAPMLPQVQTQTTPALAWRMCRASRLLRPACPSRVPAGVYPRSGLFLAPIGGPGSRYDVLELNGPRRLVLLASRYGLGKGPLAGWPDSEDPVGLRSGLRERNRSAPLLVSAVRWGGKDGALVLEDGDGGPLDDHLVFRWRARGIDRAVAVRTWEPLPEAVAALRAIVSSLSR
jgi:hypothetical protein